MRKTALLLHRLTLVAMIAVAVWGLVMALMPLRPFWIDEWRLIYNLKFKTPAELWGPLQFTQQFPRLYLVSLKVFTQAFDYSYSSLRLPALIFSLGTILLSWRITPRLFPGADIFCPLFTLIIISSETFTYYLVQTKHYEAEIFLAVLAIWQALQLIAISNRGLDGLPGYALLCISMALAPPFSYTYPIAVTPVFLIMGLHAVRLLRLRAWRRLAAISCPLFLGVCGILVFYFTDVWQLMQDQAMHHYWAHRTAEGCSWLEAVLSLWQFFASAGTGFFFEIIFSMLGIAALSYSMLRAVSAWRLPEEPDEWMHLYAALLILVVIGLFFSGRLPLGEGKFAAFCLPALSLLIVVFLRKMGGRAPTAARVVGLVLFAGLLGNIPIVIYRSFGEPEYARRIAIYGDTQKAIEEAQHSGAAILVTPGIAWPDEITRKVPYLENMTADAVLKTFPAYKVAQHVSVQAISDTAEARRTISALSNDAGSVMVVDGQHHWLATR